MQRTNPLKHLQSQKQDRKRRSETPAQSKREEPKKEDTRKRSRPPKGRNQSSQNKQQPSKRTSDRSRNREKKPDATIEEIDTNSGAIVRPKTKRGNLSAKAFSAVYRPNWSTMEIANPSRTPRGSKSASVHDPQSSGR